MKAIQPLRGLDYIAALGDIGAASVSNANACTAPIRVDAARNYWGGGPPVIASTAPGAPKPSEGAADVAISGNVTFTPPAHLTSDPAR